MSARLDDLVRFYRVMGRLERRIGGRRMLSQCTGQMGWPLRGVYFFMEPGEERTDSGTGLRVVRVGTHALTSGSTSTLWERLSQHKGQAKSGGGNHRGSIFRLLVGAALLKDGADCPTWGRGSSAPKDVRLREQPFEKDVSRVIGAMPFLWLAVEDTPGPESLRGTIERNSIALLSNLGKPALDPPSVRWLGRNCVRGEARVRNAGLWNQRHVDETYEPGFLDVMEMLMEHA
jgi:hypothetical protein